MPAAPQERTWRSYNSSSNHRGILIPATPETSEFLQSKCKLGAVLVADFKQVRNPAFHRRFFALLNLGFEYWQPTGGAISTNERKLVTGYARFHGYVRRQ